MVIEIQVIPHNLQRYPTPGDWYLDPSTGRLMIKVSDTGDWRSDALVAVHELVEALLCRAAGIEASAVDNYDMLYSGEGEPGDDPAAPYHEQHQLATEIARLVGVGMGYPWSEHEERVNKL